jgi:hypothetical protein
MCGGAKPPNTQQIAADAAAERLKLETEAAQRSNSALASKNRSRLASSLAARDQDAAALAGAARAPLAPKKQLGARTTSKLGGAASQDYGMGASDASSSPSTGTGGGVSW